MGRKAVNGYPEKSYYDNTRFGGIVASSDPLNEGSFALLTNLDVSDTGLSLVPRKGFLTTTIKLENSEIPTVLSAHTVILRDPSIQKDILVDFSKRLESVDKFGYRVDITHYNVEDNLIANAHLIEHYDVGEVIAYFEERISGLSEITEDKLAYVLQRSSLVSSHYLEPIRDRSGVTYYIGKFLYNYEGLKIYYWLKLLYRMNTTTIGSVQFIGDTLVMSVIDMSEQTKNFVNRNLASERSIIPAPIRSQESNSVEESMVTDVNRPILLSLPSISEGGPRRYLNTKAPISHKSLLDIKVDPTFHLQKPEAIVSGVNPKWAYRFDIVNTSVYDDNVLYKTPWRHLEVANTVATPEGAINPNPIISELQLNLQNDNDLVYTYYVMSENSHSWYQVINATNYLASKEAAEAVLYAKMVSNVGSSAPNAALGNLAFAYLKHLTLANTVRGNNVSLKSIDGAVYNQMNFRFITEDSMAGAVAGLGLDLNTLTNRSLQLSSGEATALQGIYPGVSTDAIEAPIYPMTYNSFLGINKMTFTNFLAHAQEKEKSHKIRIVFVPFAYRHAGSASGTPFDNVYICSLGGVYISGLRAYPSMATGDIASFADVVSVRKIAKLNPGVLERYVDIFADLGSMYIKDILNVVPRTCFDKAISITMYLKPYDDTMLLDYAYATTQEKEVLNRTWTDSAFLQSIISVWVEDRDVIYIEEVDSENPREIREAEGSLVFEDRLVLWNGNKVFISEEGDYFYFTNTMKRTFSEEIMKVISFKTILLVFTTQHLYAIYRVEVDTLTGNYTAQGDPETIKTVVWLQQPVLYNINPERKYLDVIRVYNQMILFYSNEGQLYMIKPSTMIDSETQFGIQYFNKAANGILANYDQYINERLRQYGQLDVNDYDSYVTKGQVTVRALIDIDVIKIIYSVPGRMTFILLYDVVNNRYTTYDTLSFNNVIEARHVEGGECLITEHNGNMYFTVTIPAVYAVNQNVDMHYAKMFRKEHIFALVDTGNLNLNNHITKRLRDLKIVLKNLDATGIIYNAELLLDDSLVRPFYGPDFTVRMVNGPDESMVVEKVAIEEVNELFGMHQTIGEEGARTDIHSYYLHRDDDFYDQFSLLRTETLNSSRLIEYNSSILGVGKVIRIRLQFVSKGRYKLQSFGITYKERRV